MAKPSWFWTKPPKAISPFGRRVLERPRARCSACRHVWRVPLPWEGQSKHFTCDFGAFALTLMREMPMKKAGDILGENDTRHWRMLFKDVAKAHAALDLFELVHLGVDEMNCPKGHHYLTVFAFPIQAQDGPPLPPPSPPAAGGE